MTDLDAAPNLYQDTADDNRTWPGPPPPEEPSEEVCFVYFRNRLAMLDFIYQRMDHLNLTPSI